MRPAYTWLTPFKVWIRDCSMADDHLSLGLVADVTDYAAVRRAAEAVISSVAGQIGSQTAPL